METYSLFDRIRKARIIFIWKVELKYVCIFLSFVRACACVCVGCAHARMSVTTKPSPFILLIYGCFSDHGSLRHYLFWEKPRKTSGEEGPFVGDCWSSTYTIWRLDYSLRHRGLWRTQIERKGVACLHTVYRECSLSISLRQLQQ